MKQKAKMNLLRLPISLCLEVLLCVLFSTSGYSQSIKYSAEISERGFDYAKVIGQTDEGIYVLLSNFPLSSTKDRVGFKSRKYKVAYFDFAMIRKWSVPVVAGDYLDIDNISFACEQVLITYSKETGNKREFYLQWINNRGVSLGGNTKNFELNFQKNSNYDKMEVTTSNDKSKVFLLMHEITTNNHQVFHCVVTDSSLQITPPRVIDLPYKESLFVADEFEVSNAGDIAVSGVLNKEKKSKNKFFDGTNMIYTIAANDTAVVSHEFKNSTKMISECAIVFDNKNNRLVVAGFYIDTEVTIGSGVAFQFYYMKGDSSSENYSTSFDPAKDEELKGARNGNDVNNLTNYSIRKIFMRAGGGGVIIAESYSANNYSYFDYFTQSYYQRTEYRYGNILVVAINNKGAIEFSKLIKKQQNSIDDGAAYSSYMGMVSADALTLFYNKDISASNEVLSVRINAKGERTDKSIVRNAQQIWIMPRDGKQVSADEIIAPAYQKKKLVLAKITLE
jgi:hypothetical protein